METSTTARPAGFWVRFAALWVDAVLLYSAVSATTAIFARRGSYIPFEIIFILSTIAYSVLLISWKGQTIGKALCGLVVHSADGASITITRALVRESVGKFVSGSVLLVGFLWAGIGPTKRAWHDYFAGTKVALNEARIGRRLIIGLSLGLSAVLAGLNAHEIISLSRTANHMHITQGIVTRYSHRDPSHLVEVRSLEDADHAAFVEWLNEEGHNPVDYVVHTAATHQVTIFGEWHWVKDNLLFLNRIIPDLYHRAGVTCIAMEACVASDNARLAALVESERFDSELAMKIARSEGWKAWGWKEYWDVFETVWRLNNSLPEGSKKMRIVGLDSEWDGPSFALVGAGDDGVQGPIWEKLRLFRLLDADIVRLAKRDELMAWNVERETIMKGERAIVWVGAAHSHINYRHPGFISEGKVVTEFSRMGFLLHQKYGDDVFQILLHDGHYKSLEGAIRSFIEHIAHHRQDRAVGFDVVGSPFALLRDSNALFFRHQPGVCYSDLTSGYVFLKPIQQQESCDWLEGYISEDMFVNNKPYYEALCGRKLRSTEEANRCASQR
jgi:uncharacterized RDD family membrane protein YckC